MKHRRFLGLLVAALFAPTVFAQESKPAPDTQGKPSDVKVAPGVTPAVAPQPARGNPAAGGNSWFPETNKDLGTFFGQGEAVGVFKFKNPGTKVVNWRSLTPSCQCARATIRVGTRVYELTGKPNPGQLMRITKVQGQPDQTERVQQIAVEAGEEGEIEVHLDMNGITTAKQASVDIHTDDEVQAHMRLNFHATGTQLFVVSPQEVNLNKMTWAETKEFEVTVTSPRHPNWKITRMDDAGKVFDVKWEKAPAGDAWVIKGKYGPVNSESVGGGVLKFYSDVQGESAFTVRVTAMVQGPLEMKPGGFLTLGLIRKGTTLKKEVVFEPNDGTNLEATSLTFEKATINTEFLVASTRKEGNKLIVELTISDKAPTGLVKGDLVVKLNHPQVGEKRIMFNGFVR